MDRGRIFLKVVVFPYGRWTIDRGRVFLQKWLLLQMDNGRLTEIMSPNACAFKYGQWTTDRGHVSDSACFYI